MDQTGSRDVGDDGCPHVRRRPASGFHVVGGVADTAASAILGGENLKYIALTQGTYNLQLWVNKGITSVHDLVGKTVALTTVGSEVVFGLNALLQEDGINPSSV